MNTYVRNLVVDRPAGFQTRSWFYSMSSVCSWRFLGKKAMIILLTEATKKIVALVAWPLRGPLRKISFLSSKKNPKKIWPLSSRGGG